MYAAKGRDCSQLFALLATMTFLGSGSANGPVDLALLHSREAHQLRALAAAHNVAGIEAMKAEVTRTHSSALYGFYFVALYLADTKHHKADFIANSNYFSSRSIIVMTRPARVFPTISQGQLRNGRGKPCRHFEDCPPTSVLKH